ncbi:MAG: hypothetical protein HQ495_10185 [Alphaproteobacteria bacterium]|nr:hypothetical protein [Alphaproteobacteria bacterium]
MNQQEVRPAGGAVASAGMASAAAVAMQPDYAEPQVEAAALATQVAKPIEVRAALANPAGVATESISHEPVVASKAAPVPAREPFIPPRAAAAARHAPLSKPDPFAEAALSNAGAGAPKKRVRGPSLFERMTGGSRGRKATEPEAEKVWDAVLAKEAEPRRSEPRLETKSVATPAEPAAPEQKTAVAEEPAKSEAPSVAPDLALETEEDLLEIPAFLRRQAN